MAASNRLRAAARHSRPTVSSAYSTTTLYTPSSDVSRALPKPTSLPARVCNSNVTCSRMWAGYVPFRKRWKKPPRSPMLQRCSINVGSQLIKRSLKPAISWEGLSFNSPRSTHASSTGKFAQMFGPRSASTLRNSMSVSRSVTLQVSLKQNRSSLPKTIYAANSQMVVSAGFAGPITTGKSSTSVFPFAQPESYKHPALPHSPQIVVHAQTPT